MGALGLKVYDYNGEASNIRVKSADLTAANIVAQIAAGDALVTAIEGITLGLSSVKHYEAKRSPLSGEVRATDTGAQRELKWLVRYHDDTTFERATCELPCADTAQLDPNNRGYAQMGDSGVVDAFVTAFEAFAIGPGGNAAVVDDILLVGRNI